MIGMTLGNCRIVVEVVVLGATLVRSFVCVLLLFSLVALTCGTAGAIDQDTIHFEFVAFVLLFECCFCCFAQTGGKVPRKDGFVRSSRDNKEDAGSPVPSTS